MRLELVHVHYFYFFLSESSSTSTCSPFMQAHVRVRNLPACTASTLKQCHTIALRPQGNAPEDTYVVDGDDAFQGEATASERYLRVWESRLLALFPDGMPCDEVNESSTAFDQTLCWTQPSVEHFAQTNAQLHMSMWVLIMCMSLAAIDIWCVLLLWPLFQVLPVKFNTRVHSVWASKLFARICCKSSDRLITTIRRTTRAYWNENDVTTRARNEFLFYFCVVAEAYITCTCCISGHETTSQYVVQRDRTHITNITREYLSVCQCAWCILVFSWIIYTLCCIHYVYIQALCALHINKYAPWLRFCGEPCWA